MHLFSLSFLRHEAKKDTSDPISLRKDDVVDVCHYGEKNHRRHRKN